MNYLDGLPEPLRKGVQPEAPLSMRLMLASGHLPLSFSDRLRVLGVLEADAAPEVRDAVAESWVSLDAVYLRKSLNDRSLPPELLDLVSEHCQDKEVVLVLLAHPNLGAQTLERFIDTTDKQLLDRVSGNQRLLVARPDLIRRLLSNSALEFSVAGRLSSLLGEPSEPAPPKETAPREAADEDEEEYGAEGSDDFGFDGEIPEEFSQEIPPELLEDIEEQEVNLAAINESSNIYKIIQGLSIAEKIKLATMGSRSARKLLIRDSNRIVVNAVVRSPKVREEEIIPLAQDRTTPDEVLTYIISRKEWVKNYFIKLALCKNPKTPLPKALRMLESITEKDLRYLAKDRNIPSVVSSSALRILTRKLQHR